MENIKELWNASRQKTKKKLKVFKQGSFEINTKEGEVSSIEPNTHLIAPGASIKINENGKFVLSGGASMKIK